MTCCGKHATTLDNGDNVLRNNGNPGNHGPDKKQVKRRRNARRWMVRVSIKIKFGVGDKQRGKGIKVSSYRQQTPGACPICC
jgi:hypothetical protein